MRLFKWLAFLCAAALTGCSLYPIPDDVASINTESIVRHARCEIRSAIIHYITENVLHAPSAPEDKVVAFIKKTEDQAKPLKRQLREKLDKLENPTPEQIQRLTNEAFKSLTDMQKELLPLTEVSIVYTFDFNITE